MPPTPPMTHAETDDFDALADLFLTDDEPLARPPERAPADGRAAAPARAGARLELLVQGHLPVRAAPWVSQYARQRAATCGASVALVRLGQQQLSVDLFGAAAAQPAETDEDALRLAARAASLVLLQLDEVHQAAAAADPRLSAVTVLTGANEAAVVAAYRTLKGLASVLVPAASDAEDPPTDLQVALVSSNRTESIESLERLRRAVAVFLDRPLRMSESIERIVPTGAANVYRDSTRLGPAEVIERLARTPAAADHAAPPTECRAEAPGPSPFPAAQGSVELCALIPGLRLLAVRWPDDAGVEVAADESGTLHLLRSDADGRGMERLTGAAAWARKHAALIASAVGASSRVVASAAPVMHLFTGEPRGVRHLLDADVRVHALIEDGNGARSIDLN